MDIPWAAKVRLLVTVSELPSPVPVMLTDEGLLGAVLVICSEAVRVPGLLGVKVTLIVQLEFAAKVVPHALAAMVKSAEFVPVNATLVNE